MHFWEESVTRHRSFVVWAFLISLQIDKKWPSCTIHKLSWTCPRPCRSKVYVEIFCFWFFSHPPFNLLKFGKVRFQGGNFIIFLCIISSSSSNMIDICQCKNHSLMANLFFLYFCCCLGPLVFLILLNRHFIRISDGVDSTTPSPLQKLMYSHFLQLHFLSDWKWFQINILFRMFYKLSKTRTPNWWHFTHNFPWSKLSSFSEHEK